MRREYAVFHFSFLVDSSQKLNQENQEKEFILFEEGEDNDDRLSDDELLVSALCLSLSLSLCPLCL
jgi:hypothetical protein